jgi:hypothetical protein
LSFSTHNYITLLPTWPPYLPARQRLTQVVGKVKSKRACQRRKFDKSRTEINYQWQFLTYAALIFSSIAQSISLCKHFCRKNENYWETEKVVFLRNLSFPIIVLFCSPNNLIFWERYDMVVLCQEMRERKTHPARSSGAPKVDAVHPSLWPAVGTLVSTFMEPDCRLGESAAADQDEGRALVSLNPGWSAERGSGGNVSFVRLFGLRKMVH